MRLRLLFKNKIPPKYFGRGLFFLLLLSGFTSGAQQVNLNVKDATLVTVFTELKKQTGFNFVYTSEEIRKSKPVTVSLQNTSLKDALTTIFKTQPLSFTIEESYVVISLKPESEKIIEYEIKGRVINDKGEGINSASIRIKDTKEGIATDEDGNFIIKNQKENVVLQISSVGFETKEVLVNANKFQSIELKTEYNQLDETIVIAYGTTSRRFSTGSVSKISSEDISKQPVSNVLATMSGRASGLNITQSSGVPGSSYKIEIRGRNSLALGNDPLIIIDGVPFAPNNSNINIVGAAFTFGNNGLSAFNSINPNDIESIEILKDADATAIYGSRGANGVILITTKKGKIGKPKFDVNFYSGGSRVTRTMPLMNTREYVMMRNEAFKNDGIISNNSNAYDLLVWDTTRYTNLSKLLIGGTAKITDAQVSFSGGTELLSFLINGGYHHETTVYPGDMADDRASININLNYLSLNRKLKMNFRGFYSFDDNNIISADLSNYINLPPNLPDLYTEDGNLNWSNGGFTFDNPLSFLKLLYTSKTKNLLGSLAIQYDLSKNFQIKTNIGLNTIMLKEISNRPIAAQNPANNPLGSSQFGNSDFNSFIIEPQAEYKIAFKKNKITTLIGSTWQQNENSTQFILATGYSNDGLLKTPVGASNITSRGSNNHYKYAAFFGRINYNRDDKYILNVSGRRDGSSRFGPGNQFANFGSLALGWIFTNEKFFQDKLVNSYGKVRASYGLTGNDGIGDYKYLDTYSPVPFPYQGVAGVYPTGLFNPDYGWEKNKKFETAIDLGFFKERILVSINHYRNRSSNQLIQYNLPSQTGFTSVTNNFDALIQNTGFEFDLTSQNIKNKNCSWNTISNITIPKNKLISFPGLENSSYRNTYKINHPLNIGNGFNFLGVDPQTGSFQFSDHLNNKTSNPSYPIDFKTGLQNLTPSFYGGIRNEVVYKNFQFDVFFEFRKQIGYSYLRDVMQVPGDMMNQPTLSLNRWQKPGDATTIQRFTVSPSSEAYQAYNVLVFYGASNLYTDASFIRLKNISISYELPAQVKARLKLSNFRLYILGQNLLTLTNYKGGDPESQRVFYLPPLKSLTAGFHLSL